MEKLPEDFKKRWVEALRSGEFKQGQGYLEYEGKFCCLGVLCKITGTPTTKTIDYGEGDVEVDTEYIPTTVKNIPEFMTDYKPVPKTLADMNDGDKAKDIKPHSFLEIADWIEANL
jgi:hypothetical protein